MIDASLDVPSGSLTSEESTKCHFLGLKEKSNTVAEVDADEGRELILKCATASFGKIAKATVFSKGFEGCVDCFWCAPTKAKI